MSNNKYNLIQNKYFIAGLILKIILIIYLNASPNTMAAYFVPFIDEAVKFNNPYDIFAVENLEYFPYPAVMLYVLLTFKLLFFYLPTLISLKIALLVADFFILLILLKWIKNKQNIVIILYWISPLLIYINYIHGQLDVIPTLFLLSSIYYMFKQRYMPSILLLSMSLASKTSIMLVIPFVFIFLYYRNKNYRILLQYICLLVLFFSILNLPFLFNSNFINMVFNNNAQTKLFDVMLNYGNSNDISIHVYLAIFAYLIVLFQAIYLRLITYNIFISFISFAFGVILVFIVPMPGWFYWIMPFWVYFFAQSSKRSILFFVLMQVLYLSYFAIIPTSDFLRVLPFLSSDTNNTIYYLLSSYIDMEVLISVIFTLSLAVYMITVFWIYKRSIENYAKYKFVSQPFLIGIGGNSGVGKSRIASAINSLFGEDKITNLKGDDMHKWERGDTNWTTYTHLDPIANDLYYDYNQLLSLKNKKNILRRHYDHNTGKFIHNIKVKSNTVILYDGLHPFYIKQMRNLFDLKIFISPDPMLAKYWKVQRDVKERGYTLEKVLEQIDKRMKDYESYIAPQAQIADILITVKPVKPLTSNDLLGDRPETMLSLKVCNSIYLEPFVNKINSISSIKVEYRYLDFDYQELNIYGYASAEDIAMVGNEFETISYGFKAPEYKDENAGIIQLLLLYYIFEVINNE